MPSKNEKMLNSFAAYCGQNPDQRFWQSLRNWARLHDEEVQFIFTASDLELNNIKDTFYQNDYKDK